MSFMSFIINQLYVITLSMGRNIISLHELTSFSTGIFFVCLPCKIGCTTTKYNWEQTLLWQGFKSEGVLTLIEFHLWDRTTLSASENQMFKELS